MLNYTKVAELPEKAIQTSWPESEEQCPNAANERSMAQTNCLQKQVEQHVLLYAIERRTTQQLHKETI